MPSAFLYRNRLAGAPAALSAGALAPGVLSGARKEGVGSASLSAEGSYSGAQERVYVVEIDSVASGTEVGAATFRWSRDGGASFAASGVATSAAPAALEDGISVCFVPGEGADFAARDRWTFKALLPHGLAGALDGDPTTEMRLAGLEDAAIVFDLGAAAAADAFVLYGHNLADASVTLEANAVDSWGAPPFSLAIPFAPGKMHAAFASASYRWWRLRLEDLESPDGFVRIAELHLGPRAEPASRFRDGAEEIHEPRAIGASPPAGAARRYAYGAVRRFELRWETFVPEDLALLREAFRAASAPGAGPFFFLHEDLGEAFLVRWASPFSFRHLEGRAEPHGVVSAALLEVAPA